MRKMTLVINCNIICYEQKCPIKSKVKNGSVIYNNCKKNPCF